MNRILELKGTFNQAPGPRPGAATLPNGSRVSSADLLRLEASLEGVGQYWAEKRRTFKPLITVYYKDIVAKSNRMEAILSEGSSSPNEMVVGAKFSHEPQPRHIITYCFEYAVIARGVSLLASARAVLDDGFDAVITDETMDVLNGNEKKLKRDLTAVERRQNTKRALLLAEQKLSKSQFCKIIRDVHSIDRFGVEEQTEAITDSQLITLYDVGLSKKELLLRLGLHHEMITSLDEVTWLVSPAQYLKIIGEAPFLVAMTVTDFGRIDAVTDGVAMRPGADFSIPEPQNEPVIGVIDTLFDEQAYFSSWVEYHCMVNEALIEQADYVHGTTVTSLIVDGPSLNPHLDDGCGRFRVRHFGVAKHAQNSSAAVMTAIRSIVETNKDIKVWNLSLGSALEIDPSVISPEAMVLDELQYTHDIIFVVAGTNNRDRQKSYPRIGAPADSINSLVVNAVSITGKPVAYARTGPVLYFYQKPDVSAFGGDRQDGMIVCSSLGRMKESGTSFAAPWIARKLAYLIHIMGFSREVAKALIIDSAAGWERDKRSSDLLGFGVVPTHITEVLSSSNDEIRFVVQGMSEAYEMYAYSIPVPMHNDQFPYVARSTLCYFPKCSRAQGVDYTDTEMDIQFGRMNAKGKIYSIDNNLQGDDVPHALFEKDVRARFRKWDNVKHISEGFKAGARPRKRMSKTSVNWGISIKTKERPFAKSGHGVRFGLVVTLREINGVNRIKEFVQLCRANNWYVNEVDIHARVETYEKAQEVLIFDEDRRS